MRRLLFVLCLLGSLPCFAQHGDPQHKPGNTGDEPVDGMWCGIWYDYDKSGNRIKRYYDCKDLRDDNGPIEPSPDENPLLPKFGSKDSTHQKGIDKLTNSVTVYPNPTADKFSIRLPKAGTHTHFHIYDAKGAIITSGYIDGELYNGNMGLLAPGNYIFVVYYESKPYKFIITKI